MFFPGPGSDHFFIPDPDPNNFSSRILHEKWNAILLFSCCLCFQEQSLNLGHSEKDPSSGIRKNFFPDPGGKKAPDPGSATLHCIVLVQYYQINMDPGQKTKLKMLA
jgi:hypothetical protein